MITLDGVEYTFNGYGEYQILQVAGPDFQLQGRMQPLINDDGSKSRATIYKAFAIKENGSDVVQVTDMYCIKVDQLETKQFWHVTKTKGVAEKMVLLTSQLKRLFSFQFQISGRNDIEALVNGNLMEFDEQLMMDFNGAIILKYVNSSKYSSIFDSGISVTVEEAEGILQMMLLVPPVFKGGYPILLPYLYRLSISSSK